jgi:hypothetical protein
MDSNLWFLTGQNRNPSRPETAVRIQLSPAVSHTNLLVGIRFGSLYGGKRASVRGGSRQGQPVSLAL